MGAVAVPISPSPPLPSLLFLSADCDWFSLKCTSGLHRCFFPTNTPTLYLIRRISSPSAPRLHQPPCTTVRGINLTPPAFTELFTICKAVDIKVKAFQTKNRGGKGKHHHSWRSINSLHCNRGLRVAFSPLFLFYRGWEEGEWDLSSFCIASCHC